MNLVSLHPIWEALTATAFNTFDGGNPHRPGPFSEWAAVDLKNVPTHLEFYSVIPREYLDRAPMKYLKLNSSFLVGLDLNFVS